MQPGACFILKQRVLDVCVLYLAIKPYRLSATISGMVISSRVSPA